MRTLAILVATFGLAACSSAPVTRSETPASLDPVTEFLLTSAAADFHANRPPDPVRFRNVRVGHLMTASSHEQHMLCGQFLAAGTEGKAAWTPFVTIKTSGYEQYVGAQAASFCQGPSVVWEKGDLSSALESRLASLH